MGISTDGLPEPRVGFRVSDPWQSLVATVRAVILEPTEFFRDLDPVDTPGRAADNPVVFALICGTISQVLLQLAAPLDPLLPDEPAFGGRTAVLLLLLAPVFVLVGTYIYSGIQHLFVVIFVRSRRNFEATLRVLTYATAISLLSWIPVIGYLASLYGLYVTFLGIRELHCTSNVRASLVMLVPALLFLGSISWTLYPLLTRSSPQPGW